MIFVFSAARSGSTWLAKLLDSHPDTLYLHEPDISDRGSDILPFWFERSPTGSEIENAKIYLGRLAARRDPRTVGRLPYFRKSYRGPAWELVRRSLVYGTKALDRVGLSGLSRMWAIPDLANDLPRVVIKSVSALGRVNAFLMADPSIAPILLVRHPCGFVGSMLRGMKMGVITSPGPFGRLALTPSALRLGLDRKSVEEAEETELLAWTWLISNAEAISAIQRADGKVLVYEEIAQDPVRHVRALFEWLSLSWAGQTEAFLAQSQGEEGDYYSVFRDPREAAQRWHSDLDDAAVRKIRDIVIRDPIGAQFFAD